MVEASAYTLDEILEKMNSAYGEMIDQNYEEYGRIIKEIKERLEKLVTRYPEDEELSEYRGHFMGYYNDIGEVEREKEKEELAWIKSELNHIVHWRKLGMSAGRVLPFSDYRSKRGGVGGR